MTPFFIFSGGNVLGTRSTWHDTKQSSSTFQNVLLLRIRRIEGLPRGIVYFPTRRFLIGFVMRVDDRMGMYVFSSRPRKSKMLCLPGLVPVVNDDQATGVIDGKVVRRRR